MEVDDVHEMQEHAEHSSHDPSLVPVSFTMAVLAVVLAATTLLGHRSHTEELLMQSRATDQWAYFQAKNIRVHTYELFLDLLAVTTVKDPASADKVKEKYTTHLEKYKDELKEIEAEAHSLEAESALAQHRGNRFDLGEVFLEIALVVTSITLLTERRGYWYFGFVLAAIGIVCAGSGLLMR